MVLTEETFRTKANLWEKALQGNVCTSMENSVHLLETDSEPIHVEWVTSESASKGLANLLTIMWLNN